MPSISDPFTITELPKINLNENDIIPISKNAFGSKKSEISISVAISHGSVSTFQLRPSPRATSIVSVSPGTVFTALTSTKEESSSKLCYAFKERKRTHLKIIESVDQNTEITKIADTTSLGEISALAYSSTGDNIYTIFKNGSTGCYNAENIEQGQSWSLKGKSSRTVVFATFIDTQTDDIFNNQENDQSSFDKIALIVARREIGKKPCLEVKLVSCDVKSGNELLVFEIPVSQTEQLNEKCFSYKDGYLYRYRSSIIEVYSLINGNQIKSVSLDRFYSKQNSLSAIVAVDKFKVVVSDGNTLFLVDTKHGAVLSSVQIQDRTCRLLGCTDEKAPTLIALSIAENKDMSLVGFALSTGNGSLLEAIGHGVQKQSDIQHKGFCNLLVKKNASLSGFNKQLTNELASSQAQEEAIIKQLEIYKTQHKPQNFEKIVFYLQGTDWEEIKDQDVKIMLNSENNYPVFNDDDDREVSRDFIINLTNMIFKTGEDGNVSLNEKFVPEFALNYLLTHPLFPTADLKGMLTAFRPYPRLLRQAIVATHSLSSDQLIECLEITDDEIFMDVISRLSLDFTGDQINDAFIKYQLGNGPESKTSLDNIMACTRRLIKLDIGWNIIPSLIDAGGMFSWDESFLTEIADCVIEQVQSAEKSSETMCLIDEALRRFDQVLDPSDLKKISKRELKKLSRKNAERTEDGSLSISLNRTSNTTVPSYSVEKLIIS